MTDAADEFRMFTGEIRDEVIARSRIEQVVLDDYERMTKKARKEVMLAEYRHRHSTKGCLLLHVWQTPRGRCYYQPPYDLPPAVAEAESADVARQARTTDGYSKWVARAGSFDQLLETLGDEILVEGAQGPWFELRCDHVRIFVSGKVLRHNINGAKPGSPARAFLPEDTPQQGVIVRY
ncbi:hypothetical protein TUM20985_14800 [Mycobacterium antarcticum]|uniref:hypothetical protein n=1 Tax=Mycolicibacterium sp. TUM20985 TaxID=3023370 RepID=UPI0025727213|nr:hypothetical protein [Mycolicibacterium sp. TUM20985]BDX30933.1 hypothetical protein TUM20985_14800 [Mycolicibacterium sp. TUM20985]